MMVMVMEDDKDHTTLFLANLPRKAQEIRIEVLWCWIILQQCLAVAAAAAVAKRGHVYTYLNLAAPWRQLKLHETHQSSHLPQASQIRDTNQGHFIRKRCQTLSLLSSRLLLDMFCPLEGSNTFCTLLFQREKRLMVS